MAGDSGKVKAGGLLYNLMCFNVSQADSAAGDFSTLGSRRKWRHICGRVDPCAEQVDSWIPHTFKTPWLSYK